MTGSILDDFKDLSERYDRMAAENAALRSEVVKLLGIGKKGGMDYLVAENHRVVAENRRLRELVGATIWHETDDANIIMCGYCCYETERAQLRAMIHEPGCMYLTLFPEGEKR